MMSEFYSWLIIPYSDHILISFNSRLQQATCILWRCPGYKCIHRDEVGSLGVEGIVSSCISKVDESRLSEEATEALSLEVKLR